ncbi:penicillin acylase family protein, partial [Desertihabitans aurantiacus]|uniref:penicillin acylase family protein n=1 Tax=Desertihabitans aurantiacus TaxID=2282477 RepID=UPI0018E52A33
MIPEVRRDAWGIPHLQAPDVLALARLQGRVTAQDRVWQIELDRWRMEGRTAEWLGEPGLAWDVLARQVQLEATAREAYDRLGPETRAFVDAYVEGVNEGLPAAAASSTELRRLGATDVRAWEPWTPLGIFWVAHVLFASFPTKLWRATVAERLGPGAVGLLGIEGETGSGSNAVVVAGRHTASGRPLVAGDPHRLLEIPGVYAQVHLRCPGVDVHGFTFPGVPGVQHFAHAGPVAWGITNAMADYQDLYAERLRRVDDRWEAEGPDGWEPVDAHEETLTVRGPAPSTTTVTCLRTARGPVVTGLEPPALGVHGAPTHSLRVPSQVLSDLGFEALLPLLRARSVADVEAALEHWVEPVNSVVVADVHGARHLLAGRVPDRSEALTLQPGRAWVAADTWRGWREMPRRDVPDLEVNANDRASGGGLGPEYAPPHRARRLRELALASRP